MFYHQINYNQEKKLIFPFELRNREKMSRKTSKDKNERKINRWHTVGANSFPFNLCKDCVGAFVEKLAQQNEIQLTKLS